MLRRGVLAIAFTLADVGPPETALVIFDSGVVSRKAVTVHPVRAALNLRGWYVLSPNVGTLFGGRM